MRGERKDLSSAGNTLLRERVRMLGWQDDAGDGVFSTFGELGGGTGSGLDALNVREERTPLQDRAGSRQKVGG